MNHVLIMWRFPDQIMPLRKIAKVMDDHFSIAVVTWRSAIFHETTWIFHPGAREIRESRKLVTKRFWVYVHSGNLTWKTNMCNWLVVWNMASIFHILGMIIPTDELIFFRGVSQPPTR